MFDDEEGDVSVAKGGVRPLLWKLLCTTLGNDDVGDSVGDGSRGFVSPGLVCRPDLVSRTKRTAGV